MELRVEKTAGLYVSDRGLRALAERMREDIGDSATNQKGNNRRPVGRVAASGQ